MKKNFLLNSKSAKKLYAYVKDLPIIDYHNHLSLSDIAENKRFLDVYELWVKPDPYKHRAMRMCGVPEKYITGDGSGEEKFIKWCEILPRLLGNPLYHWALMELSVIFGIDELPCSKNAKSIYDRCNAYLRDNELTVEALLKRFNVELICPCASLVDDLSAFSKDGSVRPSLRGDDIVSRSAAFLDKLGDITNIQITDDESLFAAINRRLDDFSDVGLVFSDHGLDNGFSFDINDAGTRTLAFLANEYARRGFVMQLHIGAQRYTSTRLREIAGPAGGFAAIGNSVDVSALTKFLDTLDCGEYRLPKTVLFTLNPADNALISVLSGSYSRDGVEGLITQGPAWWWCDHKDGIWSMLENASAFSSISNFVGMTTDSRSFLSFVRHDYFRRILCDFLGKKIEHGEVAEDISHVYAIAYDLCYGNAKKIMNK